MSLRPRRDIGRVWSDTPSALGHKASKAVVGRHDEVRRFVGGVADRVPDAVGDEKALSRRN